VVIRPRVSAREPGLHNALQIGMFGCRFRRDRRPSFLSHPAQIPPVTRPRPLTSGASGRGSDAHFRVALPRGPLHRAVRPGHVASGAAPVLTARVSGVGWVRLANHHASGRSAPQARGRAPSISAAIRRGRSRSAPVGPSPTQPTAPKPISLITIRRATPRAEDRGGPDPARARERKNLAPLAQQRAQVGERPPGAAATSSSTERPSWPSAGTGDEVEAQRSRTLVSGFRQPEP